MEFSVRLEDAEKGNGRRDDFIIENDPLL